MNELLQKLLESEILTEDTRQQLQSAINQRLDEAVEQAKLETRQQVEVQLAEQWVAERDLLIESIDQKMNQFLAKEMVELKEDIERFRDLETEYAQKLVEAKKELASEMKSDLDRLAVHADKFLETRLAAEMATLQEEIEACRKVEFGRQIFEAFSKTYANNFVDEKSYQGKLQVAEAEIKKLKGKLTESKTSTDKLNRAVKLQNVLRPLSGNQREVMETLLRSVPTEKLEESYKSFIGRVVKEGVTAAASASSKKQVAVNKARTLTESVKAPVARKAPSKTDSTVIKTGDDVEKLLAQRALTESTKAPQDAELFELQRLAGIK